MEIQGRGLGRAVWNIAGFLPYLGFTQIIGFLWGCTIGFPSPHSYIVDLPSGVCNRVGCRRKCLRNVVRDHRILQFHFQFRVSFHLDLNSFASLQHPSMEAALHQCFTEPDGDELMHSLIQLSSLVTFWIHIFRTCLPCYY